MIAKAKVAMVAEGGAPEELRAAADEAAEMLGITLDWLVWDGQAPEKIAAIGSAVAVAVCGAGSRLAARLDEALDIPVLAVPVAGADDSALDVLAGVAGADAGGAAGRLALGAAGMKNSILMAAAIMATGDEALRSRLDDFRARQTARVLALDLPDAP